MVSYVGSQLTAAVQASNRVANALERHEEYHRQHLQDQLAAAARRPMTWGQLVFGGISALSALAAAIIAVIALTHG